MQSKLVVRLFYALLAASLAACSGTPSSDSSGQGAASSPAAAAAQDQPGAGGPQSGGAARGRRFGELLKSLNLTPDQETKIRAIVADARKKSEGADRDTRRANMRAAYTQIETTVLTPAQRTQFETKLAALRAKYQSPAPAAQ